MSIKKILFHENNKEFNKFHINCFETNLEGTSCYKCLNIFYLGENGVCINTFNCEESYDGKCLKCKDNNYLNK